MRIFLLNTHTVTTHILQDLAATLPPFRMETAQRCRRPAHFLQTVVGFCLVRFAVHYIAPAANTEQWFFGENGKPYLAADAPYFSLSHTPHIIGVAVSEKAEIGLDIEEVKPHPSGFITRYFTADEQARINAAASSHSEAVRLWSAKEAFAKQTGLGLCGNVCAIPSDRAYSTHLICNDTSHWISVSPMPITPPITWVTATELKQ